MRLRCINNLLHSKSHRHSTTVHFWLHCTNFRKTHLLPKYQEVLSESDYSQEVGFYSEKEQQVEHQAYVFMCNCNYLSCHFD